ncbi:unnamed protein product [Linum trigynum]|uniref:PGG domain-containing protein n=1 Tax=Linum trigynum TaxID=586398 RepID=A0AAV2EIA6_9ROSI
MDLELYQAVIQGNDKFLEDLSNAGSCDVLQVTSGHKNTILHVAAKCGGIQTAEKIIGLFPGLLHQTNSKGDSPLHVAARLGRLEMIQLLVNCAKLVEIEVGKELLRMVNVDKDTALHVAVRNGHFEVVSLLISEDPELALVLNAAGESSLFLAVDRKFYAIAQHILETVPSCCYGGRDDMNVLHAAIIRADRRFLLMDALANIMTFCSVALIMFINLLLPSAFKLSYFNFRRSCSFAYIGADFLQEVLKRNPSLASEADKRGWIPLHYAAYSGNAEVVQLLLQTDASLAYVKDKQGMSALHLSAQAGHLEVAQRLTALCPDTSELLDNRRRTALHVAAESGRKNVVKFFLKEQGFFDLMNEQDEAGNTPLHIAAAQQHAEVHLLLASDPRVDKGAVNRAGLTASDMSPLPPASIAESEESIKHNDGGPPWGSRLRGSVNLVVATAIAAVTFAAIFTIMMMGGTRMLRRKPGFQLYVMANSLAFGLSTASMFVYFVGLLGAGRRRDRAAAAVKLTNYAELFGEWSVYGMVVAFAAGTAVVCGGEELVVFAVASVATGCCCFLLGPLVYGLTTRGGLWST